MWGMLAFRPYLIGTKFTSWGDHQPLLPFYNDLTKPATARIYKHRARITDLTFTDKYLSGKVVPADFNSHHPQSISHLNRQEREEMAVDDGEDIHIMRVIMNDLPPALTTDMMRQAALTDPVYHKLIQAVQRGKKTDDPDLRPYTSISQWVNSVPPYVRKLHFMYESIRTSGKCRWNIYRTSSKCRWSIYRTSRKRRGTLRIVHKVAHPTVYMG